ncbi:trypsin-like peptidase domain-containing protein [Aquipuribacter sp. MA13-6]|uniref:trypsin-like peptidase domain-containing protein n=1 Tax=unclassified Aquipuribacter TaxID=2635084 RepID=UPI003EEE37B4
MEDKDLFDAQAAPLPDELGKAADALEGTRDSLLDKDHVVGVGLGYKIKDGSTTTTPSVMVLVSEKLPSTMLGRADSVPRTVASVPTDVLEVGTLFAGGTAPSPLQEIDAQTLAKRVRPVRPGYSVGHPKVTAGTIAAGCYDIAPLPGKPARYYVLSNNHVLANSNDANIGDPIYQPGVFDGGTPADAIGRLARYIPIRFDGTCNYVDAAVAEVPFDTIDRDVYWSGYPTAAATPALVGGLVKKTGRTTHFTTGRITVVNATIDVNFGGGKVARFCNQIVTSDMSAGGDSGSLVLDWENRPVGLLFAGSPVATILNPIATVQVALGVRLWP